MKHQASKHFSRSTLRLWGAVLLVLAIFNMGAAKLKYTEDRLPPGLNPIYANDMYAVRATELIFESLVGWDKEQKPKAMLASSWKIAADKKSIVLNLRAGVLWHDNKPFTSKDVIFTIKAMTSRRTQITDRYLASIINTRKTKAMGPNKVRVVFKKRINKPLKWLHFKIIPAHKFKNNLGKVKRRNYFSQKPVGTGAFRFRSWIGKKVRLLRWKKHWSKKKTKLKGVTLQAIPDKNIQVEVLRYGGIDAIIRVRPKDIPVFERDENIRLYPYSTNDWWYIAFNHKNKIFKDQRVREAFAYALDRDNLRSAHLGDGQTISGPFSPNDPLYNFSVTPRSKNVGKAKKLLKAAGYKGSPIRAKGSTKLTVNFLIPRSKESYRGLCLGIQSSLRKIGVKVKLVWLNDAAWTRRVLRKKKFDMALHIWNFDELATIYPLFHSRGNYNYIGYKNKAVDKLLKQAAKTTDPVIYKAIFGKLHKILHKDLPYLFLWSLTNYSSVSSRVKRVTIHPFNYFHYAPSWRKKSGD